MQLRRNISGKKREEGIVILLVAVVLLFVVGAMAVLAIDLVSFYTARSEAQLAADSAALAGARVLANSGVTSNPSDSTLSTNAQAIASAVATQVAVSNKVGGRSLNPATEVTISFAGGSSVIIGTLGPNPRIIVRVTRSDIPTFFARIWGNTQLALSATSTAEAYNSSFAGGTPRTAPTCVKPWVLPNLDPRDNTAIFDSATGAVQNHAGQTPPTLLGYTDMTGLLRSRCNNCVLNPDPATRDPVAWRFYPGAEADFRVPTQSLPTCNGVVLNNYQTSIAGCVSEPIACNSRVRLDHNVTPPLFPQTNQAVNCLTHSVGLNPSGGDQIVGNPASGQPFQFQAGDNNPVVNARGSSVMVSDSLVTVPVYDSNAFAPGSTPVTIIGFVQLFLNPDGNPSLGGVNGGANATVVNLVGCGTGSGGRPILGNGTSPVAVRLVAPGGGT